MGRTASQNPQVPSAGLTPAELAAIRARGFSGGAIVWADAQPLIVALEQIAAHTRCRRDRAIVAAVRAVMETRGEQRAAMANPAHKAPAADGCLF